MRNELSIEEHEQLGTELYNLNDSLCDILINNKKETTKQEAKVMKHLTRLRSNMDDILFREWYDAVPNSVKLEKIYYPALLR